MKYLQYTLLAFFLLVALSLPSCAPRVMTQVIRQRDSVYVDRIKVDSLYVRDSIFIKEKGDTVYLYKEHIRDRYVFLHDTVALVRVDSVKFETIREVQVQVPPTRIQRFKQGAFWYLVVAASALAAWIGRKWIVRAVI